MKSLTQLLTLLLLLAILVEMPSDIAAKPRRSYKSSKSNAPFSYGATGGISISSIAPDNSSSSNCNFGFFGGGFFEYKFIENIGGQVEVNFIQFGGEKVPSSLVFNPSSSFLSDVKSVDLTMYGVDIPVTAKYHLPNASPDMYLKIGISGTYIVKAQAALNKESSIGSTYTSSTAYVDVTKKVQNMQACGIAGCGTSIPVGKLSIIIDVSFHYGITDLSANNVVANNGFSSRYLKLGIGVGF